MHQAAILYHPEGFTVSKTGKLMGRHVAGESFLKAYVRHANTDVFHCFVRKPEFGRDFEQRFAKDAPRADVNPIYWERLEKLAEVGCVFLPEPKLSQHAWQRRRYGEKRWSLCGVTHTIASDRVMDEIGALLTAPTQPWDAVICTSQSVRTAFDTMLADYGEYLSQRLGCAAPKPLVQLPIIPLGINVSDYEPTGKREYEGKRLRKQWDIADDAIAVLFMGRLVFHAKAHPFPMLAGLQQAAKQTGRKLHLIQAGWFAQDLVKEAYEKAAALHAPDVTHHFVDGRDPFIRTYSWHAADIFCSLSENMQETFGITPLEAMAAKLPVVVTDWDGYRETVKDGAHGFCVPTILPPEGSGEELALLYSQDSDRYDSYLAKTSQSTAVDVDATAAAFVKVVESADLRARLGEAGYQHVQQNYDWAAIIPQYEALWAELAELRAVENVSAPPQEGAPFHPMRPDPFVWFKHYPTHQLTGSSKFTLVSDDYPQLIQELAGDATARHAHHVNLDSVLAILRYVHQQHGCTLAELEKGLSHYAAADIQLWVGWLLKFYLLRAEA